MTECDYCGSSHMAYELNSDRGQVNRCITCLAIEQGQQKFSLPFEVWIDRDEVKPPEHDDAPDFEPFDPRKLDYNVAQAWFRILARIREDDPILKKDEDAIGTVADETREFVTNIMGKDAYKRPSELKE